MKRNHCILALLLLLLAPIVSIAQSDADAKVKTIAQSLRDPKNVEIRFDYHFTDAGKPTDAQQGKAYLQGEAYKILMNEQQTISDGKTIWTYLIEDGEVLVSNATEGTDNTPLKLLTTLDKDYKASYTGTDMIELSNPKGDFKKILLKIDSKNNTLKTAEVFADDGGSMVISILSTKFNQDLKDGFFTFDEKAHPGVDIIDMR
jgi:outer membrane lipoprotein-sorting protein